MIVIKKLLPAVLFVIFALLFTGCGSFSQPASPSFELRNAPCDISYDGKEYRASVTNSLGGIMSVSFSEPPSMQGLVYTFSPGGCKISFGDLSFSSETVRLDSRALPRLLCDIIRNASTEGALSYSPTDTPDESAAVFSGEIYGMRYTITTDKATGIPRMISSAGLGADIVFEPISESSS